MGPFYDTKMTVPIERMMERKRAHQDPPAKKCGTYNYIEFIMKPVEKDLFLELRVRTTNHEPALQKRIHVKQEDFAPSCTGG